jgi:hypothetical protein
VGLRSVRSMCVLRAYGVIAAGLKTHDLRDGTIRCCRLALS